MPPCWRHSGSSSWQLRVWPSSSYRYTFELEGLFHSLGPALEQRPERENVTRFEKSTLLSHERAGRYGIIFLLLSAFLLMGAVAIAGADPGQWQSVGSLLDVVFSGTVWLQFFIIAGASAGMCGAGMLFFLLDPDRRMVDPETEYGLVDPHAGCPHARPFRRLVLPILVVLQVATLPAAALSGWVYALAGIAILLLLASLQFTYALVRHFRALYPAVAFAMLVLALVALVTKDQVAIHTATRDRAVVLANVFDKAEADLKASLGIAAKAMSGEVYLQREVFGMPSIRPEKGGAAVPASPAKVCREEAFACGVHSESGQSGSGVSEHALAGAEAG